MINKKKIVLMSRACMYDNNTGKKEREIVKYFKSDYVGHEVTIGNIYMIIVLFIVYLVRIGIITLENNGIIDMELIKMDSVKYGILSLIIILIYTLIIVIIKSNEYDIAEKNVKKYTKILESINKVDGGGNNE